MTMRSILQDLVAHYGWPGLGDRIAIRCFQIDPSINSSLKFLRKTPWARTKVERLWLGLGLAVIRMRRRRLARVTAPGLA